MRRRILRGRSIWNRIPFSIRPFCSGPQKNSNNKPATISSNGNESSSSSLSQYGEQYKALNNLDFMTAAKILFTDQSKKKKFGLDFHLGTALLCLLAFIGCISRGSVCSQ
ncbi:hypothetical protein Adt_08989 [Abeliophyllum distichum]|uniref:Uncharacterized protein n=1 Tax=Abeliophyllum distichum TaxID=126358 RepID=A0ABD1UFX0_9LAMI